MDGVVSIQLSTYTPVRKTKSVLERQTRYKKTQAQHLAPFALAGKMLQCSRVHAGMLCKSSIGEEVMRNARPSYAG
jgi:hypothetical protein